MEPLKPGSKSTASRCSMTVRETGKTPLQAQRWASGIEEPKHSPEYAPLEGQAQPGFASKETATYHSKDMKECLRTLGSFNSHLQFATHFHMTGPTFVKTYGQALGCTDTAS